MKVRSVLVPLHVVQSEDKQIPNTKAITPITTFYKHKLYYEETNVKLHKRTE